MRTFGLLYSTFLLLLVGCQKPTSTPEVKGTGIFVNASSNVAETCEGNGIATLDEVAVSDEVGIRATPSASGERIVNQKATAALGETHLQTVDQTERLKELCRQREWSKVQVIDPDWLTHVVGWVPVSSLRQIERDNSGKRVFVEGDFSWDRNTSTFKSQLVANVNKVVRENSRCDSVDPGTLSKSDDRSRPGRPVFFITCNNPAGVFNVWFEPSDATSGTVFSAVANIDRSAAALACERAAKQAANNPQTVDFSHFLDLAFIPYPNGNSRIISSFTAKNAFGVEGKFRIACFYEGGTLKESNIHETID